LAPLCNQLRGEVPFLADLCIIKGLVGRLEICAAILAVRVKKQSVEPVIEIIVVRDIAPGPTPRIELLQTAVDETNEPLDSRPIGRFAIVRLSEDNGEYISDRALLDNDPAINIRFPEL
jgi:hypothetical protein